MPRGGGFVALGTRARLCEKNGKRRIKKIAYEKEKTGEKTRGKKYLLSAVGVVHGFFACDRSRFRIFPEPYGAGNLRSFGCRRYGVGGKQREKRSGKKAE